MQPKTVKWLEIFVESINYIRSKKSSISNTKTDKV